MNEIKGRRGVSIDVPKERPSYRSIWGGIVVAVILAAGLTFFGFVAVAIVTGGVR